MTDVTIFGDRSPWILAAKHCTLLIMPPKRPRPADLHKPPEGRHDEREYLRVSLDRSGRERSAEEQHGDNRRDADHRGTRLHPDPYREKPVSASRFSLAERPEYQALVADLEGGTFGADILKLWESSRLTRRIEEVIYLLDLCTRRDVAIYVTSHRKLYEPWNWRDRKTLLEDALDSDTESSKTSMRCTRAAEASAANGEGWGICPYGYKRERDPRTGKPVSQIEDPVTGPIVRDIFARLLAGQSIKSVVAWLNSEGTPSPAGKVGGWSRSTIKRIATSPVYAGHRTWYGEISADGNWPPLFDSEADHHKLVAMLTDPSRGKGRGDGAVKHLLAGLVECPCGGRFRCVREYRKGGRVKLYYTCDAHSCTRIERDWLNAYISAAVVEFLKRPEVCEAFTPDENPVSETLSEVQALRDRLNAAIEAYSEDRLDLADLTAIKARLKPRITAAEDKMRTQVNTTVLGRLITPGVEGDWEKLTIEQRREVIRSVVRIVVTKAPKGTPPEDKVTMTWLADTPQASTAA